MTTVIPGRGRSLGPAIITAESKAFVSLVAMKLAASGWRRDHGENVIVEKDLATAKVGLFDTYSRSETYITSVPDIARGYRGNGQEASVAIRFNSKIVLNGDYLVRLTLTKEDIGTLFVLQYADSTVDELCDLFRINSEEWRQDRQRLFKEPVMFKKVAQLPLSIRSANCLNNDNIIYVGDLVQKTEAEMLRTPNFGRRSLNEIKDVLAQMGLQLGMEIPSWPPENIEELSKRFEKINSRVSPTNSLANK
jgi:hypothetical protein